MLALGTDAELKELATKDMEGAKEAKEQAAIGDGWWDSGKPRKDERPNDQRSGQCIGISKRILT